MHENYFTEATTSNIYRRLSDDSSCAIISPYRSEYSDKENRERMTELKSAVRKLGLGFNQFISRWVENGEAFDESSLLIPNISEKDALDLGKTFNQSSIIFKDLSSCREICTTSFKDNDSIYKPGDIVRIFYNTGDHVFNVSDAEEIFSKRKSGPVSMPVKGSNKKPFTLKVKEMLEVYEIDQPRPSYFNRDYVEHRIF